MDHLQWSGPVSVKCLSLLFLIHLETEEAVQTLSVSCTEREHQRAVSSLNCCNFHTIVWLNHSVPLLFRVYLATAL